VIGPACTQPEPGLIYNGGFRYEWTTVDKNLDKVWKALADPTRRQILDLLRSGPIATTQIVNRFPRLSRFGVMKHIEVLREAGLINTRREGRRRVNSINAVPIRRIYERWVSKYEELWATKLIDLKQSLEKGSKP
jgi:DNA-binding transcriptional ArsR family regulator